MIGLVAAAAAEERGAVAMPPDHPPRAAVPAQRAARVAADTVVARVDDAVITAGDLDTVIFAPGVPERAEFLTPDGLRDLVEALIDRKLMARAARAAGLAPAAAPGETATEQDLAEGWLLREIGAIEPPTGQTIERYYRDNAAQFTVPARVRVTRVLTESAEAALRARELLVSGAPAQVLRAQGGEGILGVTDLWLQDAPKRSDLVAVALALPPGVVGPAIPVPAGFVVLRAEERAAAQLRPLDEVRLGIIASLEDAARVQALADTRQRLRSKARIRIEEAALMSYLPTPGEPSRSTGD